MTSIGRPRKPVIEMLVSPSTPKAATAGTVPGGVKVEMERGSARPLKEASPGTPVGGERGLEIKEVPEQSKRQRTARAAFEESKPTGGASGSGAPRSLGDSVPMAVAEDPVEDGDSRMAIETWRKREAEVLQRHTDAGSDPKKAKVGDQYVGALFNPTMDDEWPEMDEATLRYGYDQEASTEIPITEEEKLEAMKVELGKMDKFQTYEVVPDEQAKGKTILDSTSVIVRKPTGVVKARYCLREYKWMSVRDDVYAVATTLATAKVIDYLAVQGGYVCFTGDATNAFWQVPIEEEAYMCPPKEWLKARAEAGESTAVKWRLLKEWYGRRVAGTRWVEWFAEKLRTDGFERCVIAPWFFRHAKGIHAEVHMDDIYGCGPLEQVKAFKERIEAQVIIKVDIHPPGSQFSHLKRVRHYSQDGRMFVRPDPKHVDAVVKMLRLADCKPVKHPWGPRGGPDGRRQSTQR